MQPTTLNSLSSRLSEGVNERMRLSAFGLPPQMLINRSLSIRLVNQFLTGLLFKYSLPGQKLPKSL